MAATTEVGQERPATPMRSLERALDVLEVLQRHTEPMRLSEVARAAGLNPATTLRILAVLAARGYVVSEGKAHRLGPAVLSAAHGFLVSDVLTRTASPVLRELAASTSLTVSLYERVGFERVLVARVDGAEPMRYQLPVGRRLPLHLGAGKALAVDMDDVELAALAEHVRQLGEDAPIDVAALRGDLDALSERGFHVSVSERETGIVAASVPVRDASGRVIAAVSAAGPAEKHPREQMVEHAEEVRRAASAIGRSLPRAR
ncbi:IclR family transcriptional regulator [Promicromonospora sp. NPDC060204]|uniref:IclR family transcriptional regulator n=1 Tax=Promicromonospora sp. NPDC060204 TaxID=3347071 RepID=UPI00366409C0